MARGKQQQQQQSSQEAEGRSKSALKIKHLAWKKHVIISTWSVLVNYCCRLPCSLACSLQCNGTKKKKDK